MRFVFLDHQLPPGPETSRRNHFDLMFETSPENRLKTMAVDRLPDVDESIAFQTLADHRRAYLDYEGAVSNDRGHVVQYAEGTWTGSLSAEVELCFGGDSRNFTDQQWTLSIDDRSQLLTRIR